MAGRGGFGGGFGGVGSVFDHPVAYGEGSYGNGKNITMPGTFDNGVSGGSSGGSSRPTVTLDAWVAHALGLSSPVVYKDAVAHYADNLDALAGAQPTNKLKKQFHDAATALRALLVDRNRAQTTSYAPPTKQFGGKFAGQKGKGGIPLKGGGTGKVVDDAGTIVDEQTGAVVDETDVALLPASTTRLGIGALVGAVIGGLIGWFTPFVGLRAGALVGATIGGGAVFTGYAGYGDTRARAGFFPDTGTRTQEEIDRWVEAMRLRSSGAPSSSGGGTAPTAMPTDDTAAPVPTTGMSDSAKLAIGVTGLAVLGGAVFLAWRKYAKGAKTNRSNPRRRSRK